MSFADLLKELEAAQTEQSLLAKSVQPCDDGSLSDNDEDKDDKDNDEPLTKSLQLDNGEDVVLVDAEALIKSVSALEAKSSEHEKVLIKGLQASMKLISQQGELIKSLNDKVTALGGQGAGRKTVLNISEKPPVGGGVLAKSLSDGQVTVGELLAKSHKAFDEKRITGKELTTIDVAARQGQLGVIDSGLIAKVLA